MKVANKNNEQSHKFLSVRYVYSLETLNIDAWSTKWPSMFQITWIISLFYIRN